MYRQPNRAAFARDRSFTLHDDTILWYFHSSALFIHLSPSIIDFRPSSRYSDNRITSIEMTEAGMSSESQETPVYLYDTLAPLGGEAFDDESQASPSTSGYTTTQTGVQTLSQSTTEISSILTTGSRHTSILSSATILEGEVTEGFRESFEETSAAQLDELRLEGVASDQEVDEGLEKNEDFGASLANGSKDEELEFLSLDMNDLGVSGLAGQAALVEEKDVIMSDIGISGTQEAPPWARTGMSHNTWFRSPFLQLHQEIVDFCNFVAPTEDEKQLRADAVQRVRDVVQSIWPACQVKVFGSFATGLFLPTSDCDVVILDSGCQVPQDGLKAIAKALTRKSLVKNLQVIGKARVPIVKFVETASNISFDISFDVANGPDAADFIKAAMDVLPPLKPLCLVLKIFLQQRELNEVYTGGIGSYALLVMLLTHLQMHPSRRNTTSRGEPCPLESNLGILLVDFFDFYGRALNVRDVGISCRNGGRFFRKASHGFYDSNRSYLLSVEDPQAPDNDIGKNSYNVTKVRSAFLLAHRLLTKMVVDDVPAHVGLLGRIVRMDKELIQRKSAFPELLRGRDSVIKPVGNSPAAGSSLITAFGTEPERYMSGMSSRSRWQDYEEDDFPRGGEPELTHRPSRKRKHGKENGDSGQGDGSSHTHHQHKRRRNELFVDHGGSSSVEAKISRHGKRSLGDSPSSKPPRYHEQGREIDHSGEARASRRHQRSQKKGMDSQDDNVIASTPEDRKTRLRNQNSLEKEETHEEGEIVSKDDYATVEVDNSKQKADEVGSGVGNGHKKHKRWFDERRPRKSAEGRPAHRAWFPEEADEGSGRTTKRVVITKPAHKKIKYL